MFVIIWQFDVPADRAARFEKLYGPDGDWVRLFARHKGYRGTQLLLDSAAAGRYLTLDFWDSRAAYDDFRATCAADYARIDSAGEGLTASEHKLGEFTTAGA
jgi:heme-degrading monooxygenase HmoA